MAFRGECEVALAEADPEHTPVQASAAPFTAVIQLASRKHVPRGARKDPTPWALGPRLQEAIGKRRGVLRHLRAGVPGSKERWVEAKQHAAKIEHAAREHSQAHFRGFVEKELNKPASLGKTTRLPKRWAAEDTHRPGEAKVTEDRPCSPPIERKRAPSTAHTPRSPDKSGCRVWTGRSSGSWRTRHTAATETV